MNYLEIIKKNKELKEAMASKPYSVSVLSNIIVHQLKDVLEYNCRAEGINAEVSFGDYDNIVQDSSKLNSSSCVIIFWELCNLTDGAQYKANLFSEEETKQLLDKTKSEIDFVFENLKNAPLVIVNKFSSLVFNHLNLKENNFDRMCDELNNYLLQKKNKNIFPVDIDKVIAKCSVEKSVDLRYYYSSKALYSVEFFKSYAEYIKPVIMSVSGKSKKALILDCDNTLWKGIIGEDGADGIMMSGKTKEGAVFEHVQYIFLELNKKGVLLGLNTKNNPEDVNAVLQSHPDQQIKDKHLVIKKINWDDKVSNLKAITKELNIGLESLLMVDDSSFESNFIRENLPGVKVYQVPEKLFGYPMLMNEAAQLFFSMSETAEDVQKTVMYQQQTARDSEKTSFTNIDDYLQSLELVMTIRKNFSKNMERNAQLTQKTNQFNLTTKRYTGAEIASMMKSDDKIIFDFSLTDKFGDYGITGLSIVDLDKKNKSATIDSFLMSCRVIGRNAEVSFFEYIAKQLMNLGAETIYCSFIKTLKNEQVKDFYERLGFELVDSTEQQKNYKLSLKNFTQKNLSYIKINTEHE